MSVILLVVLGIILLVSFLISFERNADVKVAGPLFGGMASLFLWLAIAASTDNGFDVLESKTYAIQNVVQPDGGIMQIIVLENGTSININCEMKRMFKDGQLIKRNKTISRPCLGVYWTAIYYRYEVASNVVEKL